MFKYSKTKAIKNWVYFFILFSIPMMIGLGYVHTDIQKVNYLGLIYTIFAAIIFSEFFALQFDLKRFLRKKSSLKTNEKFQKKVPLSTFLTILIIFMSVFIGNELDNHYFSLLYIFFLVIGIIILEFFNFHSKKKAVYYIKFKRLPNELKIKNKRLYDSNKKPFSGEFNLKNNKNVNVISFKNGYFDYLYTKPYRRYLYNYNLGIIINKKVKAKILNYRNKA